MTLEQEVRNFVTVHVTNGSYYLTSVPVPAFGGRTWVEAWAAGDVPESVQHTALRHLRDIHGKHTKLF